MTYFVHIQSRGLLTQADENILSGLGQRFRSRRPKQYIPDDTKHKNLVSQDTQQSLKRN